MVAGETETVWTGEPFTLSPKLNYQEKDLQAKSVSELKALLKESGLPCAGTKAKLISRLVSPLSILNEDRKGRLPANQIVSILSAVGAPHSSNCAMKALQLGRLSLKNEQDFHNVIFREACEACGEIAIARIYDVLRQSDYGGDYEDGSEGGALHCKCGYVAYVTGLCDPSSNLGSDSGKFHNHCTECPGFGKCIGDYREAHCDKCGKHYFAGLSGFKCENCKQQRRKARMDALPRLMPSPMANPLGMLLLLTAFQNARGCSVFSSDSESDLDSDSDDFLF